ncbi:alanyl-tRNA editing protein AlaXM [Desulfurococcus mucosus]|uniref:Ala-tRNA(Pro) hydrolase n=1 Tax=Desulfurococcus mucosus (strain ATCC 35584 / DSM 2162 / JCM 9187 / O7/1) TaxID=765177 RepID=E8R7P3_DESM0|nr:alanyl-tRNA editing protein AlaXM [Desulfurococcus mucosus]ADV64538.1 Ala-tRNA(Pro) hydrolase [Desulfurococcus mucosus DSM 2162]
MTELVYQYDSYIKECDAVVEAVQGNKVFLDRTVFHPRSGGVENDTGFIIAGDVRVRVLNVYYDKETGDVAHEVDDASSITIGSRVKLLLDWDRRYRLMRLHTAAHVLSAVMYMDHGALITGGNITPEYGYDDYSLQTFSSGVFEEAVRKANEIVARNIEVKVYWLPREEAMRIPGVVKLAGRMPPNVEKLRIVEIPGVDIQADGGPHVRHTSEIGVIKLLRTENKGKNKKRLYFSVEP